jgi:hypothetical protein
LLLLPCWQSQSQSTNPLTPELEERMLHIIIAWLKTYQ